MSITDTLPVYGRPSNSVIDRSWALWAASSGLSTAGIAADFDDLIDLADWLLAEELNQVIEDLGGEADVDMTCDCGDDGAIPHTVESLSDAEVGRRVIDADSDVWTKDEDELWSTPGAYDAMSAHEVISYGPVYDYDEGVDDRVAAEEPTLYVLDAYGLDLLPVGSVIRTPNGSDYAICMGTSGKMVRPLNSTGPGWALAVFASFYQGQGIAVRFTND